MIPNCRQGGHDYECKQREQGDREGEEREGITGWEASGKSPISVGSRTERENLPKLPQKKNEGREERNNDVPWGKVPLTWGAWFNIHQLGKG